MAHLHVARDAPPTEEARAGAPNVRTFVSEVLRRGIVSGVLPGGTRLVQSRIAAELGVSVVPVRLALRDMEEEGLVRWEPYRGAVVREPNCAELEDLYLLRRVLEPLAIQQVVADPDATRLAEAVGLLAALEDEADSGAWAEANCAFHDAIDAAGASPHLVSVLRHLRTASSLYVAHSVMTEPDRLAQGNAEHREILRAVLRRDSEAATAAVIRHLDGTLGVLAGVRRLRPARCHDHLRPSG